MIESIEDVQKLERILKQFDSSSPTSISERVGSLAIYAQKLIKNAYNYCIEIDNQSIGFISFYANRSDTAYLSLLAVEENKKNHGIGSYMLEYAITVSKEKGMKRMRLEVHKQNSEAIRFYKKKQFMVECDSGVQALYMIREL